MCPLFRNRRDAGRELASKLRVYEHRSDALVLGLVRGGIPLAAEIARSLGLALDVVLVRPLGVPGQEELAVGAVVSGGVTILDEELVRRTGVSIAEVRIVIANEEWEVGRRERLYRGSRSPAPVRGRNVILVDDGLSVGSPLFSAVTALRMRDARRVVVALPAATQEAARVLTSRVDDLISLRPLEHTSTARAFYEDVAMPRDPELRALLEEVWAPELELRVA